jgi:DNA polymerase I-like protein with 3'-5' exonuclease and polymerase domains
MRILPSIKYSGLTVVLGRSSRFDKKGLISGYAGTIFDTYLLPLARQEIEIRTSDEVWPLIEGTKTILLLGPESMKLYPRAGALNDARGNPISKDGIVYIPTYSPQDACDRKDYDSEGGGDDETDDDNQDEGDIKSHGTTKRRNWKWWMFNDIKKAIRLNKLGGIKHNPFSYFTSDIYPDIKEVIGQLTSTKGEKLFLDLETSKRQVATCFGFNFSNSNKVFVVPWKKYNNTLAYDPQQARQFIQAITVAMHNNTVVCHNAGFDLLVLCWRYKVPLPHDIIDTMLYWHRCYPEIEKSLGHLISYFLDLPFHKDEGANYNPTTLEAEIALFNYNAKDIITMRLLTQPLINECTKLGSLESAKRACSYLRPYLTATMRGIRLDLEKFKNRFTELDLKKEQLGRCIATIVGRPDFNPRSYKQVGNYLYKDLNIPCPDAENPTNSKTLQKVLLKNPIPSIRLITQVKRTGKLASSLKYRLWQDSFTGEYNRATTGYGIGVTDTFRLGSRAIFKYKSGATVEEKIGFGTNLQNQKKEMRDLMIADEGKKIGQIDQRGAEALVMAYLCRYGRFRELFLVGIKSHIFVGLHVFKDAWKKLVTEPSVIDDLCLLNPIQLKAHKNFEEVAKLIASSDEWPARERYYFIAKMICHAANYDMKAPTFQTNVLDKSEGAIVLTMEQCREFLVLYHTLFPEIHEYHLETRNELTKTRILSNLFGEPRRFNGEFGDDLYKAGYAFKPQSTVGQITNIAFMELQGEIDAQKHRDTGLELLKNDHDSIAFQFDNNDQAEQKACKEVAAKLNRKLTTARGESFYMQTDCATGYNLRPYKKGINEHGLRGFILN